MTAVQQQVQVQVPQDDEAKACHGSRSRREPIPTGTTRILLVVLKNLPVAVKVDQLFWVFSQFGVVEKMSSFTKNSKNQLLIQYSTSVEAGVALSYLNGRMVSISMQQGPAECRLEIVPSFLKVLTFKKLDSRNRDFSSLNNEIDAFRKGLADPKPTWPAYDFLWGEHFHGAGWLHPQQSPVDQGRIPVGMSQTKGSSNLPQGEVGECVKLSGIAEDVVNAEGLFRLMSLYGNVVSAKLMAKRKGCALVQFRSKAEADIAVEKLNGAFLFGSTWEAVISKHANALHWDGAGTELQERMCTVNDIESPLPPSISSSQPSHYIGVSGLPSNVDAVGFLKQILKPFNPADVSDFPGHSAVAGFEFKESAFDVVAALNGTWIQNTQVQFYFIHTDAEDEQQPTSEDDDSWSMDDEVDFRTKTEGHRTFRPASATELSDDEFTRQRTL